MRLSADEYAQQVDRARRTARRVAIFAAISWGSGWVVIIACVIAWLGFGVSILDSLEVMLAIGIAGLLAGVGLYAQSRNLDLSASRLEIALPSQDA
jgi:uncharacterized membrane protein